MLTNTALTTIQFDLGAAQVIEGFRFVWNGSVSNGNTVNVYVDGVRIISAAQFGPATNEVLISPIVGRIVTYETLPLPHNELLQIASWSELNEVTVLVRE